MNEQQFKEGMAKVFNSVMNVNLDSGKKYTVSKFPGKAFSVQGIQNLLDGEERTYGKAAKEKMEQSIKEATGEEKQTKKTPQVAW